MTISYYFQNMLTSSLPLSHCCHLSLIQITNFLMDFLPPIILFLTHLLWFFLGGRYLLRFRYVIMSFHQHFQCSLRTVDKPMFLNWLTWPFILLLNSFLQLSNKPEQVVQNLQFPHEQSLNGHSPPSLKASYYLSLLRNVYHPLKYNLSYSKLSQNQTITLVGFPLMWS